MTVAKLMELIGANKEELQFWFLVLFILSWLVEFAPIKVDPWSAIFGWIGSKINTRLNRRLIDIEATVKKLDKNLSDHINETFTKEIQDLRRDILDFCNSCMNGRKHTKEQFEFVIRQCDTYEAYIEKNKIKNGYVNDAIEEIRRLNQKCIQNNSYLKEGEDHEIHN